MLITVHKAKTNLSRLIDAALAGELTPLKTSAFKVGLLDGKLGQGPNFFEPLPEDELAAWEGLE
jgi:hypothetical protein